MKQNGAGAASQGEEPHLLAVDADLQLMRFPNRVGARHVDLDVVVEAEEVRIGISGKAEIKHGDYETRYEEIDADMDGFKEAMNWCFDQVNPSGKKPALPAELQKKLKN